MDDINAFERLVAGQIERFVGPARTVDDGAILDAIEAQSPRWRMLPIFGATRLAMAAVIVALFGGFLLAVLLTTQDEDAEPLPVGATSSPGPEASPSPSWLADAPSPAELGVLDGTQSISVDGIPLSFSVPTPRIEPVRNVGDAGPTGIWLVDGWEAMKDDLYIAIGPADLKLAPFAGGMILWTTFPDSGHAEPCLLRRQAQSSTAALGDEVARALGTTLVEGPTDVTVGGHPATYVQLAVAVPKVVTTGRWPQPYTIQTGCQPGFFWEWALEDQGAAWQATVPGDTIRVWIVDVDGTLLFIQSITTGSGEPRLHEQIHAIIDSIEFG